MFYKWLGMILKQTAQFLFWVVVMFVVLILTIEWPNVMSLLFLTGVGALCALVSYAKFFCDNNKE